MRTLTTPTLRRSRESCTAPYNSRVPASRAALILAAPRAFALPVPAADTSPTATVLDLIAGDMVEVDRVIAQRLNTGVPLVSQVSQYIISAGGKRLRPALLLLMAGALGYNGDQRFNLAAVVEFIHTATLLHDDVVDESTLRRGRATANESFGNPASVLVGDFLYSRAFQMMLDAHDMRVMEILAEATNIIAEGEVLQLMNMHDASLDEAAYLRVIRSKTAKLFEAATRLGAILGGADEALEARMAAFGMHLGTAFQLIDDVLDYSSDEAATGKHLGDDLAEGKPTLPLIHAMLHGTPEQAALVRGAIENGGRDDFESILMAIHQTGALEEARRHARAEAQLAIDAIDVLPPSIFKEALLQLSDFAVVRNH